MRGSLGGIILLEANSRSFCRKWGFHGCSCAFWFASHLMVLRIKVTPSVIGAVSRLYYDYTMSIIMNYCRLDSSLVLQCLIIQEIRAYVGTTKLLVFICKHWGSNSNEYCSSTWVFNAFRLLNYISCVSTYPGLIFQPLSSLFCFMVKTHKTRRG